MRFPTLFFFTLLYISSGFSFAQNEDIIVTTQTDSRIFRVSIESADTSDNSLLGRAFGAHGAYKVVAANQSEFHFQFTRKSDNAVECAILSGRPARELKRFVENGNSVRNSLFRAADRAVRLTSGEEGFFASRLAFIGERGGNFQEVYTSDLFFDEIRYHTADKSQSVNPRWAPDGSKIIYTGYFGSGFPDIFVIDPNTSRRSQFASYKGTNSGARFSPNGSAVAMVLSATGNSELFISNSAGGSAKRLTRNNSLEASPSWKADGSELVFTSDTAGKPQLYTISTQGGKMNRIATQISNYCAEPDWNPVDSNKIVFTAVFGEGFQIVLWDFKLNKSSILTRGARDSIEPIWLNDGRHIVFTRRVGASKQLMIIDSVTLQESPISSRQFGNVSQADAVYLR
ncbi:MAG: biopolymer transporter Tol [Verrucomicrobia bacterium]|nr:biopolymer transporter Tol [Verrucomicrobiota bacterium]MDA1065694.1 biopolymer transporter Tol [Verrucomicrobiota bacterium]